MARDDFTEATKKKLAERVGYKCSNPFCKRVTIGSQHEGERSVNIGEVDISVQLHLEAKDIIPI